MNLVDRLYLMLYGAIGVFLTGLTVYAVWRERRLRREARQQDSRVVFLHDKKGVPQPIWQGKLEAIIAENERHDADFDLMVYPDSLVIGFAEQGYPFLTLPAGRIRRVVGEKGRVKLLFDRDDGRRIVYLLIGVQSRGLADKIEFIRKRATARS